MRAAPSISSLCCTAIGMISVWGALTSGGCATSPQVHIASPAPGETARHGIDGVDVLAIAQTLAATMHSRTWGNQSKDPAAIDCVQYVIAVVGECCAQSHQSSKFDAELRRRIAIDNILPDENLGALVDAGDERIRGVQWALVAAGLGEAISLADAQPGDFVQYWYHSSESWAGHTAVIHSIEDGRAILLGAHRTILARQQQLPAAQRTGGVGESIPVRLSDPEKRVYVARWRQESNRGSLLK